MSIEKTSPKRKSFEDKDTTFTKIFVGGIPYKTTDETLRAHFEQFGRVDDATVITDRKNGNSKGYGFVVFAEPEGADQALKYKRQIIEGRRSNVNLACLGVKPRDNQIPGSRPACMGFPPAVYPGTGNPTTTPYCYPALGQTQLPSDIPLSQFACMSLQRNYHGCQALDYGSLLASGMGSNSGPKGSAFGDLHGPYIYSNPMALANQNSSTQFDGTMRASQNSPPGPYASTALANQNSIIRFDGTIQANQNSPSGHYNALTNQISPLRPYATTLANQGSPPGPYCASLTNQNDLTWPYAGTLANQGSPPGPYCASLTNQNDLTWPYAGTLANQSSPLGHYGAGLTNQNDLTWPYAGTLANQSSPPGPYATNVHGSPLPWWVVLPEAGPRAPQMV